MSKAETQIDISVFRRVFRYVKPYRNLFLFTLLLTLIGALLGPVRPWLTYYALDNYITTGDSPGLLKISVLMIAVLAVHTVVQFLQSYKANLLGQNVVRDLRVKLYRHILNFRMPYFDKTPIGNPVTRTVSDIETIAEIFSDGVIIIIGDILQLIVIIGFMVYLDWYLTFVSLLTIPVLLVATNIFKNKVKKAFTEVRKQIAALNVFVQEHLTGMRIVQIFNRQEFEMEEFRKINEQHLKANIRSVWAYSVFFPVVEILSAVSIGLVIWWGAEDVIDDKATFGTLVAFIMYINLMFRPIRELADKFNTLQMGIVSSERIFKVMDTPSGVKINGTIKGNDFNGEIEFKNVWFAYNDDNWVLKGINLKIKAGEIVAFVGATGAGKSTIINLITRLYDIQKGEIFIDGINIKKYDVDFLRSKVAIVLQDVFLFSDSIYNNITLGNPQISGEQVKRAAEIVGAKPFIDKLPKKFDYNVRERGVMLSMGQRQLISFIRAFVYNPSILILDEATSSIDPESEVLITNATGIITKNRTSLVIAHRLSTIQNSDRIIVMDQGKIVEEGSHESLLKLGGFYHQLYEIQFKHLNRVTG
jgi:ATP-binding cassette, subfamily B, multidrug efflux pump